MKNVIVQIEDTQLVLQFLDSVLADAILANIPFSAMVIGDEEEPTGRNLRFDLPFPIPDLTDDVELIDEVAVGDVGVLMDQSTVVIFADSSTEPPFSKPAVFARVSGDVSGLNRVRSGQLAFFTEVWQSIVYKMYRRIQKSAVALDRVFIPSVLRGTKSNVPDREYIYVGQTP